ncbi:MAG: ABC transporter substrate-binding protein [Burkholderiaceae bacterium]
MKLHFPRRYLGAFLLPAVLFAGMTAQAEQITVSCGAVGMELRLCEASAEAWASKTGNEVRVVATPNSSTERLALYQQWLAAGAQDVDVYQIDVIWPGLLANHLIDLRPYSKGAEDAHFKSIVDNNTVDGKLVAMPLYVDVGLLYYRKDLLERHGLAVPTTWAELTQTAAAIQAAERAAGNDKMWGYVFQAKTYEGLTCNALEWVASYGGGSFVDDQGRVAVPNPNALQALQTAAGWIGTIAPKGVLNYAEEQARGVFQAGQAVFMRNWPYAWTLLNSADSPVRGKVGVVALPGGGADQPSRSALGGWQLAVSRYSRHPELAADLVMFMTSAEQQKRRAIEGGYNPTRRALYRDPDIVRAQPFIARLEDSVSSAVARPSRVTKGQYNRVSVAVANSVHAALSGRSTPEEALKTLGAELKRMSRRGWR